jgi:Uma2 family endonuclease
MQPLATQKSYSLEEYFALEIALSDAKHEYIDGDIIRLAGAHPNHNSVSVNLIGELRDGLKRNHKNCRVYNSDQRAKSLQKSSGKLGYFYPDVLVVCGKPQFANDNPPTLLNPTLVAEVLSEATRDYDFGRKLNFYRSNPAIQDVLFANYDKAALSLFHRNGDEWILRDFFSIESTLLIPTLDLEIPLSEIYRDVDFTDVEGE